MKQIFSSIMTLAVAIAMASCGGNAKNGAREAQELSGAGATFPLPFYNVVFENFAQVNGDIVAYGGVGSGGGVRNLRDKVVDFAGSDAFLRCGGFAIRHLLLSGFVIRFDFIINILFNNGNVQQTFLPSIVYR